MKFRQLLGAMGLAAGISLSLGSVASAEPGWTGVIIARGDLKKEIDATPILERNYRPFHFYGNTLRRQYYRGTSVPAPRDLVRGTTAFMFQR